MTRELQKSSLRPHRAFPGFIQSLAASAAVLLMALMSASCSENTAAPNPGISGPVAMSVAPSSWESAQGELLVIANANAEDLRLFVPGTSLFVRGPNAISPLSVPLGFRPQLLAGGKIEGAEGELGFVVVGGASNELVVLDTQDLRVRSAKSEVERCAADEASTACLPAAPKGLSVAGERVFAVLEKAAEGSASWLEATVVEDEGAPVLVLDELADIDGEPASLVVLPDASRAFVADALEAKIRVLDPGSPGSLLGEIALPLPARKLVLVPEHKDEKGKQHAAGDLLLAILSNGTVQSVDAAALSLSPDPFDPALPLAPLRLDSPVVDLAFVPCEGSSKIDCRTALRLSNNESVSPRPLAFAATTRGQAVALESSPEHPQIFRPVNRSSTKPSAGSVSFSGSAAEGEEKPSLKVESRSLSLGVTRTETISVSYRGQIPGFTQLLGTVESSGSELRVRGEFDGVASLRPGDQIRLKGVQGCSDLKSEKRFDLVAVDGDDLVLSAPSALSSSCFPAPVLIEARAQGDEPWVVQGSLSGFIGRAAAIGRFEASLPRSSYPEGAKAGPAFAFVIEGSSPTPDSKFTFALDSGLRPLSIGAESSDFGLAGGIAATPGRIYLSLVGGDALLDATLSQLGQSGGVRLYREISVQGASGFFGF